MYLPDCRGNLLGEEIVKCNFFVCLLSDSEFMWAFKMTALVIQCRVGCFPLHRNFRLEEEVCICKPKDTWRPSMKNQTFPTRVLYIFSWGHCLRHCFPSGVLESSKEQKAWANSVQWDMILTLFSFLLWQLYNRPNEECMYCVITHLLKFKLGAEDGGAFLPIWSGTRPVPNSVILPQGWWLGV